MLMNYIHPDTMQEKKVLLHLQKTNIVHQYVMHLLEQRRLKHHYLHKERELMTFQRRIWHIFWDTEVMILLEILQMTEILLLMSMRGKETPV